MTMQGLCQLEGVCGDCKGEAGSNAAGQPGLLCLKQAACLGYLAHACAPLPTAAQSPGEPPGQLLACGHSIPALSLAHIHRYQLLRKALESRQVCHTHLPGMPSDLVSQLFSLVTCAGKFEGVFYRLTYRVCFIVWKSHTQPAMLAKKQWQEQSRSCAASKQARYVVSENGRFR